MQDSLPSKPSLEALYRRYNRKRFVHPDPLEFLYRYPDPGDREVVGLIASSLAYGRVAQILRSVDLLLNRLGPSPRRHLLDSTPSRIRNAARGFKHRFTDADDIASLLLGIRHILRESGSLGACFCDHIGPGDTTILPALQSFVRELRCRSGHLIPCPSRGSACKRLNLYLRWMVRKDAVDPGCWGSSLRGRLIVPLDTHMARIGREWGLTSRRSASMRMALDITKSFARIAPRDPVRYDFVLTRFGIRHDMDIQELLRHPGKA